MTWNNVRPITTTGKTVTMLICDKSSHLNHDITGLVIFRKIAGSN